VNVAEAKIRSIDADRYLYVDEVDGYKTITAREYALLMHARSDLAVRRL
jgi:hypothetical protein